METQNERIGSANHPWMSEEAQLQLRLHQQIQEALTPLPREVWQALDRADRVLAIGSGAWMVDQAKQCPTKRFFGIESTTCKVDIARLYARQKKVENTTFQQQELHALASVFSQTEIFSFIHTAFIAESLLQVSYPALVQSLYQLCRPGDQPTWTECEFPTTSSANFAALIALICKGLDATGHRYEPPSASKLQLLALEWTVKYEQRRHLGITTYLGSWLRRAGFGAVQLVPHSIDVSLYAPAHTVFVEQVETALKRVRSFLLEHGLLGMSEFDTLVAGVLHDVKHDDFCGQICGLTAYGYKPRSGR